MNTRDCLCAQHLDSRGGWLLLIKWRLFLRGSVWGWSGLRKNLMRNFIKSRRWHWTFSWWIIRRIWLFYLMISFCLTVKSLRCRYIFDSFFTIFWLCYLISINVDWLVSDLWVYFYFVAFSFSHWFLVLVLLSVCIIFYVISLFCSDYFCLIDVLLTIFMNLWFFMLWLNKFWT